MDNSLHISDKVKGIEILSFDHVELIRNKVGKNTFIDVGTLGVVFFPEFHRFVLFLGDWEYVLLKRIPIVSSSRTEMKHRFYNLPTYTGFYTLRFNKITHPEALQNFDTILAHYSKFSYYGEPAAVRQNEASPDASLIEEEAQPEIAVADRAPMTKSSSEMLVSEEAKPGKLKGAQKLKKGFAKLADKLRGGSRHQAGNYFMTQVMDIQSLTTAHGEFAPVEYFGRNEVEAGIVKSKDMASKMHFGVSPNEIQFINLTELRETIEHRIENINGEDVLISQSEADIIAEIEKERQFQEIERQKQQEHRDKELFYIQKERELRDEMRRVIEEHKMAKLQTTEQKFQIELDHRDDLILEQARIRENEKLEFERKEQALYDEIGRRLGELRAKDKLTEEEHLEFARREAELLEINKRREEERKQMMLQEQHLLKQACATEITLKEREKKLALAKAKFHEMERDLRMKQVGLNELRKKANLSADERVEIQRREEEIAKMIALQESERISLERQAIEIESNAEVFRAQIAERELLTEAERIVLIEKEKEIEAESQRVLAELRAKESLTEDERLEIERRQKELKRIAAVREAERLEFIKRKEELEIQAARREAELREKERFTEAERVELERIKAELQRETQLEENEQRKLQAKRNMLFEEAERRAAEIQRRANLTEAERLELIRKEEALEKEIEGKLAALRLKEILTEEDRADLEEEEKKLTKLKEFREIQIKTMGSQFEEVRKQEEKLLQKNNEMIQTERVMHKELTEMKKDLEKPSIAEISMNVASV